MPGADTPGSAGQKVAVRVFAPPQSPCADGRTWKHAAETIFARIAGRFGDQVDFEFIELFSAGFFDHPAVMARLQSGSAQTPIITVGDEVVQCGGKISERTIREALVARGLAAIT